MKIKALFFLPSSSQLWPLSCSSLGSISLDITWSGTSVLLSTYVFTSTPASDTRQVKMVNVCLFKSKKQKTKNKKTGQGRLNLSQALIKNKTLKSILLM